MKQKLFTLLTLLLCLCSTAWAQTENIGNYSTQVISIDNKTSTWTFITPSSQVTVPNTATEDNDIIYVPSASSKMKFSSSNALSWQGESSGYIYVPAGSSGTISMTPKSSSDSRYLQLYVNGTAGTDTQRLWSKYNATSDGKKGPQSFSFTSSDITTHGGKTYLHFKDNNNEMKITSFTVTLTTGSYAPDPSISADNVNIEASATGGSIAYTISNPVTGGAVTAAKKGEADWLTAIGTETASPISFTTTANEGAERSATVTLTYTYNTNETVTKDVTITQAASAALKYAVTYDLDGGLYNNSSDAPTQGAVTSGTVITMPAKTPTKADNMFLGWKSSVNNNLYAPGADYTMTAAATTFTAQWQHYANTVDFNDYVINNIQSGKTSKDRTLLTSNYYTFSLNDNSVLDNSTDAKYQGFKMKKSGDYITFAVPAGNKVTFTFGYVKTKPTLSINGATASAINVPTLESDNQVVEYEEADADRLFKVTTANDNSMVIKKIEISNPPIGPALDAAASSPAANATNIALNGTGYLKFSKNLSSVTASKITISPTTNGETLSSIAIDGTDASKVNFTWANLVKDGEYTITIDDDAVSDGTDGNEATTLTFKTIAKTDLVGAWTTSTFVKGSEPVLPTFTVTGGTKGTDYTVAYTEVSDPNNIVTVDAANGITAVSTANAGTATVKATITVVNTADFKATTNEVSCTVAIREYPDANLLDLDSNISGGSITFTKSSKYTIQAMTNACKFSGNTYTNGLKHESATSTSFTTTDYSTITIVKSLTVKEDKKLKMDNKELSTWDNVTVTSYTGATNTDDNADVEVYTITDVAAGEHVIVRNDDQPYMIYVGITYTPKTGTTVNAASEGNSFVVYNDNADVALSSTAALSVDFGKKVNLKGRMKAGATNFSVGGKDYKCIKGDAAYTFELTSIDAGVTITGAKLYVTSNTSDACSVTSGSTTEDIALVGETPTQVTLNKNNDGNYYFSFSGAASEVRIALDVTYSQAESVDINVSSAGYSTLYYDKKVAIPEGVEAYYGKISGESFVMTAIEDVIPANTGVILKAAQGKYNFVVTTDDAAAIGENDLTGSTTATTVAAVSPTYGVYTLGQNAAGVVGMRNYTGTSLRAYSAYIIKDGTNARSFISFSEGETTAINGIEEVAPVTLKTRKVVKNGRLVIETANGEYSVSGARVK